MARITLWFDVSVDLSFGRGILPGKGRAQVRTSSVRSICTSSRLIASNDSGGGPIRKTRTRYFLSLLLQIVPFVASAAQLPMGPKPRPADGTDFILKAFDHHRAVGIGDLPSCDQLHVFLRSLVRNPAFVAKVNYIVVDSGHPRFQAMLDRYVLMEKWSRARFFGMSGTIRRVPSN